MVGDKIFTQAMIGDEVHTQAMIGGKVFTPTMIGGEVHTQAMIEDEVHTQVTIEIDDSETTTEMRIRPSLHHDQIEKENTNDGTTELSQVPIEGSVQI